MADDPRPDTSMPEPTASTGLRTAVIAVTMLLTALVAWRFLGPRFFATANSMVPAGTRLLRLDLTPLTPTSPPLSLDDLRGKVTLVNFWGTWCPPCREEFPHLAAIEKQYRGHADFQFVSISLGLEQPEDIAELSRATRDFLHQHDYDLSV